MMRLLGLLVQLLATVGICLSIAGTVGVWMYKPKVEQGWNRLAVRGDETLAKVRRTLGDAHVLLDRASGYLAEVKKQVVVKDVPPEKQNAVRASLAKMVLDSLKPQLGDVGPILQTLNDSAAIAGSILRDLEVMPSGSVPFLDQDQLKLATSRVAGLARSTQNLANLLGESDRDVGRETDEFEQALSAVQTVVVDYKNQADELRGRFDALRQRVDLAFLIAPWCLTFLLAWFGISQISLWLHARHWG